MGSGKPPQLIDVVRRVEAAMRDGGEMTLEKLMPELAVQLGSELGALPVSEVFGLDLLAKAPATWLNAPPLPVDRLGNKGAEAVAAFAKSAVRDLSNLATVRMLMNEGAVGLLSSGVAAVCGPDGAAARKRVEDVLALPAEKVLPAGAVSGAIFSPTAVFEEQIHAWAQTIRTITECWYVPMLTAAIDISRFSRGKRAHRWDDLVQVGDVMAKARNEWPASDARRKLLHDSARRIRNADAHCKIDVDVQREVVTFTTIARGRKVLLGPLTKDGVSKLGGELIVTCMAMKAALELIAKPDFAETIQREGLFAGVMRHIINPLRGDA